MLKPFSRFCVTIGAIPESIIKSLSYEQQLLRLIKFLKQTVIPAIDGNTTAIQAIEEWIKNINLQDEVNNKLDEMAKSGELEEIISAYLNSKAVFGFDTVKDMKSATNLIAGSYAETMGFNSINDGGGNLYRIKEITTGDVVDEKNIIALSDTLIAVRIDTSAIINVKDFGAIGDGVHDDTSVIQYCIDKFVHRTIFIPDGKYLLSSPLSIKAGNDYQVNIDMSENAVLYTNTNIDSLIEIGKIYGGTWSRYDEGNVVHIKGGLLDCNNVKYGIYSNGDQKGTSLSNLNLINVDRYGIYLDRGSHTNVSNDTYISNCRINGKTSGTTNEGTGIYAYGTDNIFDDIVMLRMKVAFEIYGGGNEISNIHICTGWEGDIVDSEFNQTIAFKYTNVSYENLSNIYLDTYATGFEFNGNYNRVNISNVSVYYYYNGTENTKTKFISVNTTISSNNRIYINNVTYSPPRSNGRNNIMLDLSNAGSGFREYLIPYKAFIIRNVDYNIDRISANDYLNIMQLRDLSGEILLNPYSLTMTQDQYYPIAILNRGIHEFNFRQGNTVLTKVVARVDTNSANSEMTTSNIYGTSNSLSLNLLDIGLKDQDNRNQLVLAIKCSTTNVSLNPAVSDVNNNWNSNLYTLKNFPTQSGLDLSKATLIVSRILNQ